MYTTIDYSQRTTKAFDAVEDVKEWFGKRWDTVSPEMAKIKHCGQFAMYASLAGIQGYPVIAWYELYNGQGSWRQDIVDAIFAEPDKLNMD